MSCKSSFVIFILTRASKKVKVRNTGILKCLFN